MSMNRIITALFAVVLALPAAAQLGETAAERMRRARQPTQVPAPAPQGQASGQQAPGQSQLTDEQRAALGAVWARSTLAIQAGEMAASRGASGEVRELGSRLAGDHRHYASLLTAYLRPRGADTNALPSGPERQRIEAEMAQLSTKSGEEFDREFVAFLTRNHASLVEDAKRARDVTPGKDAELKKWLDDLENAEENHLAQARQLKAQRQARTPPAR